MEINYLKEFVVLAETGNYLQAAEALFISQSSLSKHIQAMEKELGVPLFDRTTRKISLTKYGNIMLKYAQQIANIQYQYTTELQNQSDQGHSTITIGSIPVMAPYHITDVLMKYKRENKNLTVNLVEGESAQLKDMLRHNKCDLAFVREDNGSDDEFAKIFFAKDHLVAVLPSYHPLAKKSHISLDQLKEEDFLFLQPSSLLNILCHQECQKAGFSPKIAYTGQRAENIIDLIEKGMGVSLLMRKPIEYLANSKIALVDIYPSIETQIKIYYKKDTPLTNQAKHFISSIQTYIATAIEP